MHQVCMKMVSWYDWNVSCVHEEVQVFFKLGSRVFGVNACHQGAHYRGQGIDQAMSSDLPQPSASQQFPFSTSALRAVKVWQGLRRGRPPARITPGEVAEFSIYR